MNPLSQLGILRTALGFTGAAASAAGAATGELVDGVSQSFHDIFSQAAESPGEVQAAATPGRLQKVQADLLAAVRGALARAGIGAEQVTPLELVIAADHQGRDVVSVADGHPQRSTLEMILQADQEVTDAAYRLIELQCGASHPGEPLRLSLSSGPGGTLA